MNRAVVKALQSAGKMGFLIHALLASRLGNAELEEN
jgi:hypothetical protein